MAEIEKALRQMLLLELCKYFRLDYDEIEGIDEIKMYYIYDKISHDSGKIYMDDILGEIDSLNMHFRNRRYKLNTIYNYLKMKSMLDSGRYDTSALRPPIRFWHFDDY